VKQPPQPEGSEDRAARARRRGRFVGVALFALLLGSFTVVSSSQVIAQAFFPAGPDVRVDCRAGLLDLIRAVRAARHAAEGEAGGERAALERFRGALEPAWSRRPALAEACEQHPDHRAALRSVDRLRYAEEHAVRYEGAELAKLRRRVQALEQELSTDGGTR
jgi:hypothetical protein